jgi:hypothetical protein
MKRFGRVLAVALSLAFAACGDDDDKKTDEASEQEEQEQTDGNEQKQPGGEEECPLKNPLTGECMEIPNPGGGD